MDLYESPDPMILIRNMINTKNKELTHLLNILDQTPDVKQRINEVMTRLKTYKVISIISSCFIFM
jgi:uncharacterized protein (DUF1778 family)